MPLISTRGSRMPESPIRKLVPYAESAKEKGVLVYHLNIGQPDIKTPDLVLDQMRQLDRTIIEYSHSAGFASYREGLVQYYKSNNINVGAEEILISTAGSEAILFALLSCMNEGEEIIIPEPFYTNYSGFAEIAGVIVRPITTKIEDGFALPEISAFEEVINRKTKAIMICNPNNPTGCLYSREELESLKKIVLQHNLYLISDEVYREFCYDGKEHFSALNLEGIDQHTILVDSVSKRYSMCGARIGMLISKNKDIMRTALKYAQARLSPPTFGQIAAESALDTPASYFEEVAKEYVKRRDFVINALNKMKGVFCPTPSGAFYTIARLPIDDCDSFCQWLLEEFTYNNATVMLAPASGFYATQGLGKDEVRIAYVLNIDDLGKAMECLERALEEYPGRKDKNEPVGINH
ncbi:MAG TPA: pyridoxal phosphate-dependent aminotransferase [Flavobacteriales bacterium]|nr:pyridoxal phosphate-dependent aminotransferase [Flavobacteriales bacterium]HIN40564.1 pyridoxal phosphate-dependent aminotransferase [Flavobacteriales bacterium]